MEPNVPPPEEDKILYDTLSNDKEVKQVTRVVPYFSKLQLSDVSLKVRSFGEDRLFSTNKFYRENIRRGLSFIHEERIGTSLCRRGLEKFFDLRVEYFDVLDGTVELEGTRISRVEKQLYGVIFEEVVRALNEGGKIVVYKTEKANGENAQISYNKKHDAWIVASKNVSMLLRNRDDIEAYRTAGENGKMDVRYSVAAMIAESWFDWLSKTTKSEELKKEILGKTIVGEYCGHPDYQHLVTYKNVEIKFFAMVDLHGKRSCNPIDKTKEFFTKFGLPQVKMEARRSCSNVKELIEVLQELTKEVSQSTIEQDQEGSVLYFEGHREDKAEILSLCKIKTLEYRLYRKLREKLKTTIRKGNSIGDQLYKYKKEVEALCKGYNTPQPLAHYYDTAELAMNFVKENLDKTKDLRVTQRYLDFLNVILECKRNGALPSLDHFKKIMEAGELSRDESDVDEEAYDEEGNVIKEEQKVEEDFKERIQDDGHARRVVVVIPGSASAIEVRNTIQEKIKNVHLESDWAAGKLITEHKSVTVLEKFPDLKDVGGLEKNTFFLVVGGGKEEATGEDILKPEYEKFVEEVRKALPNNSMILPVGDANRIAEEVELGFGKVRSL